ncbi:hypothetical protein RMCBS344292_07779 [Rhizopus microsporus]|nr:hypothetical protein RMCBS344292_07779 [Rhizopus microsporus]
MNTPYNITAKEYVPTFAYVPAVYPCAKVTNIPWDVSQNDVRNFFGNCRLPSSSVYTQSIHILMDRTTGKTLSDAYVEFASVSDLWRAIETRSEKPLKGRIVTVTECSPEELLSVVFPKWRGQFQGNMAIPPTFEVVKTMSTAAGGGAHSACPPFITREEINSLLVVCKNYKLHFSRKCAERPFENIITVITKYPWHQAHLITTIHRDHIYELLKLSIESLKTHLSKDYIQIDPTLLERLVRAGIMCPAFTERQKMTLLQTSRLEKCPVDIVSFMYPMYPFAQSADYYSLPKQQQQQQKQQQRPVMTKRHSDDIFSFHQINVENVLGDDPASISSLIRDIQQQCQVEDRPSKPTENKMASHGIPLLLHPLESKGSPWTSSSSTSSLPLSNSKSDIWKASSPVLESNKLTSSKALAA